MGRNESNQYFERILSLKTDSYFSEGSDMTVEIISRSISMKVWDRAAIKLGTQGSAVRHASVARHVTDCTRGPVFRNIWTVICDFQQCAILTSVDSDEPVQPPV